jgi:hypothetical protein
MQALPISPSTYQQHRSQSPPPLHAADRTLTSMARPPALRIGPPLRATLVHPQRRTSHPTHGTDMRSYKT